MRISLFVLCIFWLQHISIAHTKSLTEENIKEFLRKNPSVIFDVLRENSVELLGIVVEGSEKEAQKELEQQIASLKTHLEQEQSKKAYALQIANRPFLGTNNAPVTIVAYSDFLCPYCANSAENISLLLSQHANVKYVFKAYTKNPLGQSAYAFFLALWTKDKQKAFEFYNTLFTHQEQLIKEKKQYLLNVVKQLGHNPSQIQALAESSAIKAMIEEDMKEGDTLHIKGTPTIVLNGKYTVIGAVPPEVLQYAVEYAQKYP